MRHEFEPFFGHDFSAVRVHTGPTAARSAHDVDARAYTLGNHIVLGADEYASDDRKGHHVLAHELTHVVQQSGGRHSDQPAAVQRLSLSDVLETGAEIAAGPLGGALVRTHKQFIDDLVASVKESPQHVGEFFMNEVWEQIKAHWLRITIVTLVIILTEEAIAVLIALPEPTMLTKVIAAILQIAIIAVLATFAAVEVKGAYDEGRRWLAAAHAANGDPNAIAEASRAFVRMVWHIVMAVLALAGVRARIRGATLPRGTTTAAEESTGAGGVDTPGGTVTPISSHPAFRPRVEPTTSQPGPSAFGPGGTARQLAPPEPAPPQPLSAPVTPPAPTPAEAATPAPAPAPGPGVQPVPAAAAGIASAGAPKARPPFVLRLPQEKQPHLATYRAWLGALQSDPAYDRGAPAQLERWHQAHRIGGSHGIPSEIYERGHALGLTGEAGERLIRLPNWSRARSTPMEVDHIIELQVTPAGMRDAFDVVDNYELLDRSANGTSGPRLRANIARERAIQVAHDPTAAPRVLVFDRVEPDSGQDGERWSSEEIRAGAQLDAYGSSHP